MAAGTPDYHLEITGLDPQTGPVSVGRGQASGGFRGRPWLAVQWNCCGVYSRVYRNRRGDAYEGRCPKCGAPVRASIGPGGTSSRFFEAG
jgi:hypothetical protein